VNSDEKGDKLNAEQKTNTPIKKCLITAFSQQTKKVSHHSLFTTNKKTNM